MGARYDRSNSQNLCEITDGPPPLLIPVLANVFFHQRLALAVTKWLQNGLKLTNILKDQKVFCRIKGLSNKNKSVRQRNIE